MFKKFNIFKKEKKAQEPAEVDIFDDLFGLDDVKELYTMAINASGQVNLLNVGPPGCGKSKILQLIEAAYPRLSCMVDGMSCTGAGILEKIKVAYDHSSQMRVEKKMFLLIDEIEKADKKAREVLLNAIERGKITKTTKEDPWELTLQVYLFATCNSLEKMQKQHKELLDRMEAIRIDPLTLEQFEQYAVRILVEKEGKEEEFAFMIAERIYQEWHTTSVRKCIRIARLAKTPDMLERAIQIFKERELKEMGQ